MPTDSILGFLALRMASSPEYVATEALGYILRRSARARACVRRLAAEAGASFGARDEIRWHAQTVDDDGKRPDLVGVSTDGPVESKLIIMEGKFWAGLTEAQPNAYLASLEKGGLLLLVVPKKRLPILWDELIRLAGAPCGETDASQGADVLSRSVGEHVLAITSWDYLLSYIAADLDHDDRVARLNDDVQQLRGLCDRMDAEGFLPLTSEDMTSAAGRRVVQFGEIVDDLARWLVDNRGEVFSNKGLRAAAKNGRYGRYLYVHGLGCFLMFSARWWAQGFSPVVLRVKDAQWHASTALSTAIKKAKIECRDVEAGCDVAIRLPLGVDRSVVLDAAKKQVLAVADALAPFRADAARSPNPTPATDGMLADDEDV